MSARPVSEIFTPLSLRAIEPLTYSVGQFSLKSAEACRRWFLIKLFDRKSYALEIVSCRCHIGGVIGASLRLDLGAY